MWAVRVSAIHTEKIRRYDNILTLATSRVSSSAKCEVGIKGTCETWRFEGLPNYGRTAGTRFSSMHAE